MKKLLALLLACVMGMTFAAYAAEWGEGLSAAKPYERSPEIDLSKTIGYLMLNPSTKMPAQHFCDTLRIYLPREDIELSTGLLHLYNAEGEVASVDFTDAKSVDLRKMSEEELNGLIWGSGVCIDILLPVSLKFGENYYVNMDAGCFQTVDGALESLPIDTQAWSLEVVGDFGVSGLYYSERVEKVEEDSGKPEGATEGEQADSAGNDVEVYMGDGEYKAHPEAGDVITFDLLMGGDAKAAVVYSENNSVIFHEIEYAESATITGLVTDSDLRWGIVFLDENGNVLGEPVELNR